MPARSLHKWRLSSGNASFIFEYASLSVEGRLGINEAAFLSTEVFRRLKASDIKNLIIDLQKLNGIDSAGVMAIGYLQRELSKTGLASRLDRIPPAVSEQIALFSGKDFSRPVLPERPGFFESVGTGFQRFFTDYIFEFILLAANVFYWSFTDVFRKNTRRRGEVVNQSVNIGVNAVLIVVFLSLVIGFVMALQSAGQLRSFGANLFVVDLVVIAVTSQMGPLITGVLVAGRSGSAIAAEIATMKVTEELDALRTMGLNPIRFVVVPKLYASLITLPVLVVMANMAGIVGGAIAADMFLDITPEIFINRMGAIMSNKNIMTSFVKSQVYASIVVLTGSFYGFRVTRGAEGVGRVTTTAVVVAITLVILADAVLGTLFY